ncbi:TPA: hypothetical protein P1858_003598 [Salmonella enterica subsp. enterica serovar Chester]|nr:hypothetical protein [Salmonella enterica subsp. enterica serovar Chester]
MNRLLFILALIIFPVKSFCAVYMQSNGSGRVNATMDNVANGVGRTILSFTSPAGGRGYGMYCSQSGMQTYSYVRAFSVLKNTVTVRNTTTGQSYEVPVICPACSYSTSSGFLNVGGGQSYPQSHECYNGLTPYPYGATTSLQTTVYVSLQDSRIPAGRYEGEIIGSVGEISESYNGEYGNFASALIGKGMQFGTAGVIAMKFDVVVPEYTECTSVSPIVINHGSLTPDQVAYNEREQHFSIVCSGPANIKISLSNLRPKLGDNIYSRLKLSSDNSPWLEQLNTVLADRGTKIINIKSTLETEGDVHAQSLSGNSVITIYYE